MGMLDVGSRTKSSKAVFSVAGSIITHRLEGKIWKNTLNSTHRTRL